MHIACLQYLFYIGSKIWQRWDSRVRYDLAKCEICYVKVVSKGHLRISKIGIFSKLPKRWHSTWFYHFSQVNLTVRYCEKYSVDEEGLVARRSQTFRSDLLSVQSYKSFCMSISTIFWCIYWYFARGHTFYCENEHNRASKQAFCLLSF